jgi:sigma-B regulation protein RsbU (phosphoserine phosphatase)
MYAGPLQQTQAPRLKVIVAEDSDLQRLFLCSLINGLGFEAIEAADGDIALDLVARTKAEIVISDLEMPHLDGIDLTREIRARNLDQYVHVIMVTGADDVDLRDAALVAGVDDFITKESSPALLKARLQTAVRLINHAAELADRTRIIKETNQRIQDDLRAAAVAQCQLLPNLQDEVMGFRVASAFVPSSIVSGDMFGYFELNDEKLGFYAVDVSGHGVHASLLSVAIGHLITPDYFRTHAFNAHGQPDPAGMVATLNSRFSAFGGDDYFTMFCCIVDRVSGRLDFCQAGYPSAFYVDPAGRVTLVGDGGFPVGMMPAATYENNARQFEIGATLVICSDAAAEAENLSNQPFGTPRLGDIARLFPRLGVDEIPQSIVQALNLWRNGVPLEDDLTVLALERKKPSDTYNNT